jgi:transposase
MTDLPELPDFSAIKHPAAKAVIDQLVRIIKLQQERSEKLERQNAELKRMVFGQSSERMPPMDREVAKKRNSPADKKKRRKNGAAKRRKNRKKKKNLRTEDVHHHIEDDLVCPECGGTDFVQIGEGDESFEYEYVPGHFVRRRHLRQKKACKNGCCILTAPAPRRVSDGVQYGPGFHAHVVVSKCADSLPLYRQAKQMKRNGVPISRSTLCDCFHRSAELLKPLWEEMIKRVSASLYVNADETPMPVLAPTKTHRGYVWTFIDGNNVTYHFSPTRSGETPIRVLGNTKGLLQVDGYSGYNKVCTPHNRTRVGCIAHVRRKFFDARKTAPEEAQYALDRILDLYFVEYEAAEKKFAGTPKHLKLREEKSAEVMERWGKWLQDQQPKHRPESPIGKAISYATNNWKSLTVFLEDAKVSLDNNISENALRIAALGRKNWLFVGHEEAGQNWAILQSLLSTCLLHEVNPQKYLADVLIRIQTHPQARVGELLPQNWKSHFGQPP